MVGLWVRKPKVWRSGKDTQKIKHYNDYQKVVVALLKITGEDDVGVGGEIKKWNDIVIDKRFKSE